MDELRSAAPELVDLVEKEGVGELLDLKPEEVEAMLSVAFFSGANFLLDKMKRENATMEESERWAKVTRIVYAQWIMKVEAGIIVHAILTTGIFASKKKLPPPKADP